MLMADAAASSDPPPPVPFAVPSSVADIKPLFYGRRRRRKRAERERERVGQKGGKRGSAVGLVVLPKEGMMTQVKVYVGTNMHLGIELNTILNV